MFIRVTAFLLCLFSFPVVRAQTSNQSCADQLHDTALNQTSPGQAGTQHAISARRLAIPADAWRHYQRAVTAATKNQVELAESESDKALLLAPGFAEVHLLRAMQLVNSGHPAEALPFLATARSLAPDLPWLSIVSAGVHNQLRGFDEALRELDSIPGHEAASWQGLYEKARAEIGLHDLSAALRYSQLAVAAAPAGCTDARLLYANVLQFSGRPNEVITELEHYLSEDRLRTHRTQVQAALEKLRASLQIDLSAKAEAGAPSDVGHALLSLN